MPPTKNIEPTQEQLKAREIAAAAGGGEAGTSAAENAISEKTARQRFGTDFTGVTKVGEDTFVPDKSAQERYARTIAQPEPEPIPTETTEQIQARKRKEAQAEIDSLNRFFQGKLAEQREINVGQERRTAAVSTLTGLAGSTEAGVQARKTEALGERKLATIRAEQEATIQSILSDVRESAVEEARFQKEEARLDAETALNERTRIQEDAMSKLSILGSSGTATIEGLRESLPPEDYDYLIRNVGGEAVANAILFESRPKQQVKNITKIDSGIIQTIEMPDGTFKQEYVSYEDIGVPVSEVVGIQSVQKLDNGQVMIINEDGTWKTVGDAVAEEREEVEDEEAKAIDTQKSLDQIAFLKKTLSSAKKLSHASGRSPLKEFPARVVFGATDKTRLESFTNTLRTNVLTLVTDPSIQEFFGPQMSEADVKLMTAGGTTLNPDLQNPEDLVPELERLEILFNDIEKALKAGQQAPQTGVLTSPDGKQAVNIEDLTPEEVQEARNAGWK